MGLNINHVRSCVIRPTLQDMEMYSPAAENLLVGTGIVESGFEHLVQLGSGPARGVYQVEPSTAADIIYRYLETRPLTEERFEAGFQVVSSHDIDWKDVDLEAVAMKLTSDLRFATAVARLRYWMVPEALPDAGDYVGLGGYWKKHYNTSAGAGTAFGWTEAYRKHGQQSERIE